MKQVVVIDANIALKWVLNETDSSKALAMVTEWNRKAIVILAPALLSYEVTNILYRDVRAGKITADTARNGINVILKATKLEFSQEASLSFRAMELAHQFSLPAAYDAHYLALAERESCDLWTADKSMWRAVKGQLDWVHNLSDYSPN